MDEYELARQIIINLNIAYERSLPKDAVDTVVTTLRELGVSLTMRAADLRHACGECGNELQIVRPGKYQCVNPKCGASR